jgi:hypothetical protein
MAAPFCPFSGHSGGVSIDIHTIISYILRFFKGVWEIFRGKEGDYGEGIFGCTCWVDFKFGFVGGFVLPFPDLPLWGRGTIRRMVDEVKTIGK